METPQPRRRQRRAKTQTFYPSPASFSEPDPYEYSSDEDESEYDEDGFKKTLVRKNLFCFWNERMRKPLHSLSVVSLAFRMIYKTRKQPLVVASMKTLLSSPVSAALPDFLFSLLDPNYFYSFHFLISRMLCECFCFFLKNAC